MSLTAELALLERILAPERSDAAPYLLSLGFPDSDRQRLEELEARARAGTLTAAEQADLESYRHVRDWLARVQEKARQVLQPANPPADVTSEIAPGILRAQQAFWRDLPELLKDKRKHGQWVCYHGDERIGIARSDLELIRECQRRGLRDDEYDLDVIEPRTLPPWEPEDVEPGGNEVDEEELWDHADTKGTSP